MKIKERQVVSHWWRFSSVQFSRSVVSDSVTPWIAARQASLSITNSRSSSYFLYQLLLLLLLSCFSCVRLCATPEMAAHQAPPSLGFSRQEHWSGLPFPSPMHESEKWKWSRCCAWLLATPWTAAYQAPPSLATDTSLSTLLLWVQLFEIPHVNRIIQDLSLCLVYMAECPPGWPMLL